MPHSTKSTSYRARWVFPVDQSPIANGVVTIAGGRIAAVGTRANEGAVIDLGNVALLPGLINAHTHLEFSLFDQPLGTPGQSFASWLKHVIAWRREQPAVQGQESLALEQGLRESAAAGVALLGEIAPPLFADFWANRATDLSHVVFLELLSLNPERVDPLTTIAEAFSRNVNGKKRFGLSPHAPYTVHPQLLERVVRLSSERGFPVTMHLAESREELELLDSQTGELVELLKSLSAWYPASLSKGLRPLDYLRTLSQAHHAVIAHGNFLQVDEIEFVAQQRERLSIAYCPRTQAHFDHGPYPLAALLAAGARVAVGTDSRASNPDLSIWNELKFIRVHYPQVAPAKVLKLGTINGAEALCVADHFGTISPGKAAALAIVDLSSDNGEPYELLFAASDCRPLPL